MAFPKKILWIPIGWKDLGKKNSWMENDKRMGEFHQFCRNRVRVGKEDNKLFTFCPRCKVKTYFDETNK